MPCYTLSSEIPNQKKLEGNNITRAFVIESENSVSIRLNKLREELEWVSDSRKRLEYRHATLIVKRVWGIYTTYLREGERQNGRIVTFRIAYDLNNFATCPLIQFNIRLSFGWRIASSVCVSIVSNCSFSITIFGCIFS